MLNYWQLALEVVGVKGKYDKGVKCARSHVRTGQNILRPDHTFKFNPSVHVFDRVSNTQVLPKKSRSFLNFTVFTTNVRVCVCVCV